MDLLSARALAAYWSGTEVAANVVIFLNLLGALLLGILVGYERSFHGRAAGMRTYGLVCMASAALTVFAGYPDMWFGGHGAAPPYSDPTRVVQGIVTGIGFLGAGVIVKEGFSISGLNTAASIWAASAIGVLLGVGFYAAAICLAVLSALCMSLVYRLEQRLPARGGVVVSVRYEKSFAPSEESLRKVSFDHGYEIAHGSLSIRFIDGQPEWHFLAIARDKRKGASVAELARMMSHYRGVESFHVAPAKH
ncbi:MAG TPA: MgtC/SapB family protein [Burkholderiaceae bacterium]|nr:MgtC/SapB family protein [Burkholderiaceae bacterium]